MRKAWKREDILKNTTHLLNNKVRGRLQREIVHQQSVVDLCVFSSENAQNYAIDLKKLGKISRMTKLVENF